MMFVLAVLKRTVLSKPRQQQLGLYHTVSRQKQAFCTYRFSLMGSTGLSSRSMGQDVKAGAHDSDSSSHGKSRLSSRDHHPV